MKLYELREEYLDIIDELESSDSPEIEEGLHDRLAKISEAIEVKADNIARMIANYNADAEAYKAEAQRLTDRRRTAERRAESLKGYLFGELKSIGVDKVKGELFTVGIQKSPPSAKPINPSLIPEDYWIEQEPKLDTSKLRDDLKSGKEIPGAELHQGEHIRIR